jgi:hypothetical protein
MMPTLRRSPRATRRTARTARWPIGLDEAKAAFRREWDALAAKRKSLSGGDKTAEYAASLLRFAISKGREQSSMNTKSALATVAAALACGDIGGSAYVAARAW